MKIQDKETYDKLLFIFQGNQQAAQLMSMISFVVEIWDDLIDKDEPVNDWQINTAFRFCLIDIPGNPVYQSCPVELRALIMNGILGFHDANKLVKGNTDDQIRSYQIRLEINRIANYLAYKIGGEEWAIEVGADICRMYEEPVNEYLKEHDTKVEES